MARKGKPRRYRDVKVAAETHDKLRNAAQEAGVSQLSLIERIISDGLAAPTPPVRDWPIERQGSVVIF